MRLRRLLRVHEEYQRRLLTETPVRPLAIAASSRLLQLLQDVRATWNRESEGFELSGLRVYVNRSLAAMQAAAAAMARPNADLRSLGIEFREAGLPLVFFLRGLDDAEGSLLTDLATRTLPRSA